MNPEDEKTETPETPETSETQETQEANPGPVEGSGTDSTDD
jgi:hypothetical protein